MLKINSQRLLHNLTHLRNIGKSGNGVMRLAFSPRDMEARRWVRDRMREIGLKANIDGVGNVIGLSRNPGKAVLIGSHTDTQPQGGWLDGALGVIYGLEIAATCAENDSTAHHPIDVVSWGDEEGTYLGMLGSRSYCGMADSADIQRARNHLTNISLSEAIKSAGLERIPPAKLDLERYAAYLEAHVEQGPHLDTQKLLMGIVTAIVGIRTFKLTFRGEQNHAGSTPMAYRKDAAAALFKFANRIDHEFSTLAAIHTVWTIGHVRVEPGSHSVIPGMAEMLLQFRDISNIILGSLEAKTFEIVKESNDSNSVEISLEEVFPRGEPAHMNKRIQHHLCTAAEKIAPDKWINMPSGAVHDAQILANHLPTGMLFVPSIGGISHNIKEDTSTEDIVRGCQTLLSATESILQVRDQI